MEMQTGRGRQTFEKEHVLNNDKELCIKHRSFFCTTEIIFMIMMSSQRSLVCKVNVTAWQFNSPYLLNSQLTFGLPSFARHVHVPVNSRHPYNKNEMTWKSMQLGNELGKYMACKLKICQASYTSWLLLIIVGKAVNAQMMHAQWCQHMSLNNIISWFTVMIRGHILDTIKRM